MHPQQPLPEQPQAPGVNQPSGKRFSRLLFETLFLLSGILFAFWLSEWDEQRKLEQRTEVAMQHVIRELNANYQLLTNDYVPRHKAILEHLDQTITALSNPGSDVPEGGYFDRAIMQHSLQNSAWRLAMESGYLLHVDFGQASDIAALYSLQTLGVESSLHAIIDIIRQPETVLTPINLDTCRLIQAALNELLSQEDYLAQNYQQVLKALELPGPKN